MNSIPELNKYLECEINKLNCEFPKYEEVTADLFQKVYEFLNVDFESLSDNRVYRYFLVSFKEIICYAFDRDVSKAYLRFFFKIMNKEIIVGYIANKAKSRAKDIKNIMDRFLHFFKTSWQGYYDDKDRVLGEIICLIDYWM